MNNLRIIATENCNAKCPHCFNADVRDKGFIDVKMLSDFFKVNKNYFRGSSLKIMGGEPTLHPEIKTIIRRGLYYFGKVTIFTNGLILDRVFDDSELLREHFRGNINTTINGFVFDFKTHAKLLSYLDNIVLHFVVPYENSESVISKIIKIANMWKNLRIKFVISADTQLDIFDKTIRDNYRKTYLNFLKNVVPELRQRYFEIGTDHCFPMCFFNQEMLSVLRNLDFYHNMFHGCCANNVVTGLLDLNFDLWFCNQTRIKICSVLDGDSFIQFPIEDRIRAVLDEKIKNIADTREECKNCKSLPFCKIGCYYNTLIKNNH